MPYKIMQDVVAKRRAEYPEIVILMETKAYSCVIWSHGLDQSE